jgi:hypothetical protein
MICVVAGAVQWEYIVEGQGRWWVGALWLFGAAGSIVVARHTRRTTVVMVLRGVVVLLVIGAIAQHTPPAYAVAAISGLALVLLQKFWHNDANPNSAKEG